MKTFPIDLSHLTLEATAFYSLRSNTPEKWGIALLKVHQKELQDDLIGIDSPEMAESYKSDYEEYLVKWLKAGRNYKPCSYGEPSEELLEIERKYNKAHEAFRVWRNSMLSLYRVNFVAAS